MSNAVALLRGMNVGGHRITNVELVEIVKALGLTGVMAYQASGNVLFDLSTDSEGVTERLIEEGLAAALGYSVPTMVRTAQDVHAVLAARPFGAATHEPAGKPQIAFFKTPLSSRQVVEVEALAPNADYLAVVGRELHWWPDVGLSDSTIDWASANRIYGPLTIRTRATVERIAKKFTTR